MSNLTLNLELERLPKSNGIIFKMDAVRLSETSAGTNGIIFKMNAVRLSETSAGTTRCQNSEDCRLNIIRSKSLIGYIQQK